MKQFFIPLIMLAIIVFSCDASEQNIPSNNEESESLFFNPEIDLSNYRLVKDRFGIDYTDKIRLNTLNENSIINSPL